MQLKKILEDMDFLIQKEEKRTFALAVFRRVNNQYEWFWSPDKLNAKMQWTKQHSTPFMDASS